MTMVRHDPTPSEVIAWSEDALEYLSSIEEPREAAQLSDAADALRYLAQKAGLTRDVQNAAAAVALEAEIRIGKLTAGVPKLSPPGKRGETPNVGGISRWIQENSQRVSRARELAAIPDDKRDAFKAAAQTKGSLTRAGLARYGRNLQAEAKRQAEAKQNPPPPELRIDLRFGDFRDVLDGVSGIDAIITDPPYGKDYLDLLPALAVWADGALSEDGVLAVLFGQTWLPDAYRLLEGHRPYRWTMCYQTPGAGYVSHAREVQSNWKPILLYGKGPRLGDVVTSLGDTSKDHHKWGQDYAAFRLLVERLTTAGQTVADPFAGAGTTLLAASSLGRHVLGAELEQESFDTMQARFGR